MHSLIRRFAGGYKSNQQGTQEESLCRRSNLACGLESLEYPIPALGAAWVPDVCVFRADERAGYQLLETPFWIGGVIACALRNFRSDTEKDLEFVRQKIETVLAVAASQGHTSLVLGAWGCGAFGNDAPLVARLFAEALRLANGIFATVVFALVSQGHFDAFEGVFPDAHHVQSSLNAGEALRREQKAHALTQQALAEVGHELCALAYTCHGQSPWERAVEAAGASGERVFASRQEMGKACALLGRSYLSAILQDAAHMLHAGSSHSLAHIQDEFARRSQPGGGVGGNGMRASAAALDALEQVIKDLVCAHVRASCWRVERERHGLSEAPPVYH